MGGFARPDTADVVEWYHSTNNVTQEGRRFDSHSLTL